MAAKKNPRHAKREPKQQLASKNGKKSEGGAGGSFFTWFIVLALLGVWTSVAVVWFDLVDYESVVGKLGSYDADGDGDFDLEDAKVLLGPNKVAGNWNMHSFGDVLGSWSEQATDGLLGFFTFVYEILTPFEIEEEECKPSVDVPVSDKPPARVPKKAKPKEEHAVRKKVRRTDEEPGEVSRKERTRDSPINRDAAGKLKEALKRQLAMIHERVEAKKIARLALAEVRSAIVKEEEARHADRALERRAEAAAAKARERSEERLRKAVEKMEREEDERAEREAEKERARRERERAERARERKEEEEEERKAKKEREEKRAEREKRKSGKKSEREEDDDDDEEDEEPRRRERRRSKEGRGREKKGGHRESSKRGQK
ncbi:hypothetical protein MATL_G00253230 [Megalops atlanticus]|uniref:Aspartyl beta-hydroxylase/Triadin domain-containing protein n=1 Tax=Megalops atlanticus TaxID=7932 RepID=A0A9D3PD66_MEGAT|nr:hypothetical protein MATL_G00253230 [Megalops atlanticus]